MGGAAKLDFRVLGPLEVRAGDEFVSLPGRKERALLAILLLHPNEVVPTDRLMDDLWGDDPPATAGTALHVHVSQLRKALGGDVVRTRPSGYVLELTADQLDVLQFERLVEEGSEALAAGDDDAAARKLRAALALWRGAVLADFRYDSFAQGEIARLEELRLACIEDRIDAELDLGRHGELVAELESLVEEHPLRERLRGQLMLALYRAGRQAEALAVYRDGRSLFREELGLEPTPELRKLEAAILRQEPSLTVESAAVRARRHLPAPRTALIGRRRELAQLRALLEQDHVRLVTLTGTGGIGKTRLALEIAAQLAERFRDGVFFVDLAALSDSALVAPAIARKLGLVEGGTEPPLENLKDFVRGRQTLLVLDTFEHVLDAALVVSELLEAGPELKVLATSRATLHLYGEHEYELPPLELPNLDDLPTVDELEDVESVALFIARARAVKPDFVLSGGNERAVAGICVRLDGLPLAIELAAAQSKVLSPEALLERLSERLPLLVGGPRDWPARQRTLRAAIEWSYGLLDREEQRLLDRLSVFVGGWGMKEAKKVSGAERAAHASLLEKSLLRHESPVAYGSRDVQRFSMLDTIREYAHERLRLSGEAVELGRRHAEYFLSLAEDAEPALRGPAQSDWLRRLDAEQANLRAALTWALDCDRIDLPLRLAPALWRFWEARGSIREARELLDVALGRGTSVAPEVRAKALFATGRMALRQGDYDHARTLFEEGLALSRAAEDRRTTALSLAGLGWVEHVHEHAGTALMLCREALAIARRLRDKWVIADVLNNLGCALRAEGDLTGAKASHDEALALRREVGDLEGVTASLANLGWLAVDQADYDGAQELFEEALELAETRGDRWAVMAREVSLGYVALCQGDLPRAAAQCERGLALGRSPGYRQYLAFALETLSGVLAAEGLPSSAGRVWGAAVTLYASYGAGDSAHPVVGLLLTRARESLAESDWQEAFAEGRRLSLEEAAAYGLEQALHVSARAP